MTYDGGTITGTAAIIPVDPTTGQIKVTTAWADIEFRIDVHGYFASNDTITFDYDPHGLRTTKTGTHTGTTEFTWSQSGSLPLLLTETRDGSDTHLVYGPGNMAIADITGTNAHWYHRDNIGSTRLITDDIGGVAGTYTYEPYGTLADSSGSYEPVLSYAGEYVDNETGLVYLRARYLDPATGQFLSRDPLVGATQEPYSYASGNPGNRTDPTGLWDIPGTNWCIDIGDDNCESIAEQNEEITEIVVDIAGGVLDVNPITAPLPLDLEGHGVDLDSGWADVGRSGMLAFETGFGLVSPSAAAFNTASAGVFTGTVCSGIRSGSSCVDAGLATFFSGFFGLLGGPTDLPELVHLGNIASNLVAGFSPYARSKAGVDC